MGTSYPDEVKATPMGNLEEPYHMNSSHALAGLLHGHGLLNRGDFSGGTGDLDEIQHSFPIVYSIDHEGGGCAYFTQAQCRTWPVMGPPLVANRMGQWWLVRREENLFSEHLAWKGTGFDFPDVLAHGEQVAAFYLTEGASDETFSLLVTWWDALGRRAELQNELAGCPAGNCAMAMSGSNFSKMGVFLAAAALERALAKPLR